MIPVNKFLGQEVLISGGVGFIGSNLAHRLVKMGANVTILDIIDAESSANPRNIDGINDKIQFIHADIRDEEKIYTAIQEKKFFFNLAGQTSHLGSLQDPIKDLEINGLGQLKSLEACRKYNPGVRVVYTSTRQVYGRVKYVPVDENHPVSPVDYNGVSKLAGAMYHLVFNNIYGIWTTVLRLTNVYGPRMRIRDNRLTFIGYWFKRILNGDEVEIYGNGKQIRDLNHVEDVVDALLLSVTNSRAKGKIYNLGGEPVNLLDLANLMIELNGKGKYKLVPFPENRKRIDIGDYAGDYSQIKRDLGWEPKTPLREGIESTLDFYRNNWEWYS